MRKHTPLIKQALFFGTVGIITLGIDVTVTTVLFNLLNFPAYLASAIGFVSGFFFNFPMNKKKVFRHTDADKFSLHRQIVFYMGLSMFNLFATSAMVELLVTNNLLEIQYAKLLVTAIIATWNFLLFKFFIFSKKSSALTD